MPKPQHVDDKLYDDIVLLFRDGFYRTLVFFTNPSLLIEPA